MDFDDLLAKAVELLHTQPDLLAHYQRRFKHVLVDEYQDTNVVQNDLVLALAKEHHNVCVVGDGDQCLPTGTMISTPTGPKPIEQIEVGDEVLGTGGRFELVPGTVTHVKQGEWSGRQYLVTTESGHTPAGDAAPHRVRRHDAGPTDQVGRLPDVPASTAVGASGSRRACATSVKAT